MNRLVPLLAILSIIVLSFFLYSFNYSAALNSDGAIQILMTYYYTLPNDLYFWGQDRWGSLIPLISQFFFKVLNLKPITAVSISYYLLLIAGYAGYCSLFKTNFSKIALAFVLFLPPLRFVDLTWHAVGIQYALLGISIFLFKKIDTKAPDNKNARNHFLLAAIAIVLFLSAWVTETALVTFSILSGILIYFLWRKIKFKLSIVLYMFVASAASILFIRFAKSHAMAKNESYVQFNDTGSLWSGIEKLKNAFANVFTFSAGETLMSIYSWLALVIVLCISALALKRKITLADTNRKWLYFFAIDGTFVIILALLSKWVFMNEMNRRYFLGSYVSIALAVIISIEYLSLNKRHLIFLKSTIIMTLIIGALSAPHYFKLAGLQICKPQIKLYEGFLQLGQVGIIAEYWHSYIVAAPDPSKIIATPEDHDQVRNYWLANQVFLQPKIYVIRNDWMSSFPDTLNEFGRTLIKDGEGFRLNNCDICKYKVAEIKF